MGFSDFLTGGHKSGANDRVGPFGGIFGSSSENSRDIQQPSGTTYNLFGRPYENQSTAGKDYARSVHPGGQCKCTSCGKLYDNAYDANHCKCRKPWET